MDKFIGDAVMAFWGAPSPAPDHAKLACTAALECQQFVATLEASWTTGPRTKFLTRIGIQDGMYLLAVGGRRAAAADRVALA